MRGGAFRDGQVYLGWQHVVMHPDPGPPPRRPVPPEAEQVNPGWLAAQRREESLLSRPHKVAATGWLVAAVLVLVLGRARVLDQALTWLGTVTCAAGAGMSGRAIWRGRRAMGALIAAETQRAADARAVQERRLFTAQAEHARMFRDWQSHESAFARQPRWYPVTVPGEIDRVDVVGGTLPGWSALLTTLAAPLLATGGEVTVIDLSEGTVARDLVALGSETGVRPLVWVLPGDLPRLDLGVGLPAAALADVLATSVSADPAGGGQDQARDQSIIERVLQVLGERATVRQAAAGLRALAQVGDPREDISMGLLTAAQLERITGLFGRGATDRVVIERALALEARLRHLERLGSDTVPLPYSRLRVVAMDRGAGAPANAVAGAYVTVALTHLLRQVPAGQPWLHTLCLAGAEKLGGDVIDRLCDACEIARTGLVLAYRSVPAHVKERLGRGNAALAVMRLGNAEDARAASEQIGAEHRFVLSQFTATVGNSLTGTTTDSYTSTVGTAGSVADSVSVSHNSGHSRGRGHSRADVAPFGQQTGSGTREVSNSRGTSDSRSLTEGITTSTSWGVSTAMAIGVNESLARTVQRSREFLVEAHELQRLPPSALIVSYASREGRQAVLADANPAILALPTATLLSPDEARQAEVAQAQAEVAQAGVAQAEVAQAGVAQAGMAQAGVAQAGMAQAGMAQAGVAQARPEVARPRAGTGAGGARGTAAPDRGARQPWVPGTAVGPAGAGLRGEDAAAGDRPSVAGPGTGTQAPDAGSGRQPWEAPAVVAGDTSTAPGIPAQPVSWRARRDQLPPNLGPPAEPLDWRKRRGSR